MNRDIIIVHLWPKHTPFAGKRVDHTDQLGNLQPSVFAVTPSDAELLIREYINSPDDHQREIALSITAALREWREEIAAEDDERIPDSYAPHVERREPMHTEETPIYGHQERV